MINDREAADLLPDVARSFASARCAPICASDRRRSAEIGQDARALPRPKAPLERAGAACQLTIYNYRPPSSASLCNSRERGARSERGGGSSASSTFCHLASDRADARARDASGGVEPFESSRVWFSEWEAIKSIEGNFRGLRMRRLRPSGRRDSSSVITSGSRVDADGGIRRARVCLVRDRAFAVWSPRLAVAGKTSSGSARRRRRRR